MPVAINTIPGRFTMTKFVLLLGLLAFALPLSLEAKEFRYVGVKKCSTCHKKEKQGRQLGIWKKSGHSKAFRTLASAKAKERAAKLGVSGNPQQAGACLVCHVAGYGLAKSRFGKKFKVKDGVQCEACHGPGQKYRKKKVMKKIYKERGLDRKGDSPTAKKTGLIFPGENTCKGCHTREITRDGKTFTNPSYKPFDFAKMKKKFAHPVPGRK